MQSASRLRVNPPFSEHEDENAQAEQMWAKKTPTLNSTDIRVTAEIAEMKQRLKKQMEENRERRKQMRKEAKARAQQQIDQKHEIRKNKT